MGVRCSGFPRRRPPCVVDAVLQADTQPSCYFLGMLLQLLLILLMLQQLLLLLQCIVGESLEVQVLCGQGLEGEGVDLVGIAGYEVGLVEGDGEGRVGVLVVAVVMVEAAVRLLRLIRPALLQRLRVRRRRRWVGVLSK